jgi:hypothetical protein
MARGVEIPITATDKTAQAFRSVQGRLAKLERASEGLRKMARFGAAAGLAIGGAAAALTKMSMSSIDNLAKTADKLGTTTETLAGLQHAAELTGVSTETMNMALQRMTRRVAEAAQGTGEATGALQELGIDAESLVKLPLDQQMEIVADAMSGVETQADRVRLAMKLFDSEGVSLVNTLGKGSGALKEMMAEAEALGTAISRVDAAQIEAANDAVTRARGVFEGLGNQLAVALSPIITHVADMFRQSALDAEGFGNIGLKATNVLARAFGFVGDAIQGVRVLIKGVQVIYARMVQGILTGFSAITPVIDGLIERYNQIASALGLSQIEGRVTETLTGIADAFGRQAEKIQGEIAQIVSAPLPSETVMTVLDEIRVAARKTAEQVAATVPGAVEAVETVAEESEEKLSGLQTSLADALVTGVKDGKDGMLDAFANILQQMAAEALKAQLTKALFGGGDGGSGLLGGLSSALGGFFGGGKADGGTVMGGKTYLVGERGPELFTAGRTGTITPNGAMGSGLTYAPVVTIQGGATEQDRILFQRQLDQQKAEIFDLARRGRL